MCRYKSLVDRDLFLETISQMSERFKVNIFAYVLMSNHHHHLVRTNSENLKKTIRAMTPILQSSQRKNREVYV